MRGPLLIATCLLSLAARGEVFWRLPGGADALVKELGGTSVYATDVTLNGAPGVLTAHAIPASSSSVCASLARRLGLSPESSLGGTIITHAEKGRLSRLIVLPSGAAAEACVVLAFDQSSRDAARSRQAAPAWPDGLPALSAAPLFTAVCDATRTTFVAAETAASPDEAARSAAQALSGAGWTETVPSSATFKTFCSGRKTCVVLASRNGPTARTSITVLQREGASP